MYNYAYAYMYGPYIHVATRGLQISVPLWRQVHHSLGEYNSIRACTYMSCCVTKSVAQFCGIFDGTLRDILSQTRINLASMLYNVSSNLTPRVGET